MKTIKQQLAAKLRALKPHQPREAVMIAENWFVPENEADTKRELKEVRAHIRAKFEQTVSYLICHQGKSRQAAEEIALKDAEYRIASWTGDWTGIAN